ncbi:MAG TPA: tail fiber domain-containing protein [Phycisphaerae bacterium]|nr:tail fiber domain-containing protein [Phycisphaerae bacterium]
MNTKTTCMIASLMLIITAASPSAAQSPVGTAFTYQGQLKQGGLPVTNTADFQFSLWNALAAGTQVGTTQNVNNVAITNGLFTVTLDFGADAFPSDGRWLEIAVRAPAGGGSYTTLSPRQKLSGVPYALGLQLPYAGAASPPGDVFAVTNSSSTPAGAVVSGTLRAAPAYVDSTPAAVLGLSDVDHAVGVHGAAFCGVYGETSVGWGVKGYAREGGIYGVAGYMASGASGCAVYGNADPSTSWAGFFQGRGYFSGDVGIGIIPTTKLEVAGTVKMTGFQLTAGAANGRVLTSDAGGVGTWQLPAGDISGSGTVGKLAKFSGTKTLTDSIITETADGKIGVNWASPTYRFSIAGTLSNDAILCLEAEWNPEIYMNAAGSDADCKIHMVSASRQWNIINDGSEDRLTISRDGTGGVGTVLCLEETGSVGIGLVNPTEKLDVIGTARLRGIGSSTGTAVVADANGKLWKQSSSRRYKTDIHDLNTKSGNVLDLQPVSFRYRETGEPDIGLIAEDVNAKLKDLVLYDAEGRPDAVKYDRVALYLLDIVKSQREQIAAQHADLAKLRARLDKIERALDHQSNQPQGGVR